MALWIVVLVLNDDGENTLAHDRNLSLKRLGLDVESMGMRVIKEYYDKRSYGLVGLIESTHGDISECIYRECLTLDKIEYVQCFGPYNGTLVNHALETHSETNKRQKTCAF